jgi:nickel transport protein
MRHRPSAAVLGLAALLLTPGLARAHGIESSLTRLEGLSGQLMLQSQFSSGQPTADAVVRLVPPAGQPLELGRTDSQGRLSFALPAQASGAWELQVDGGPGHRDYLEMPVRAGQADLERISLEERAPISAGWIAALSGCGAAAMLLGLQRIRRPR